MLEFLYLAGLLGLYAGAGWLGNRLNSSLGPTLIRSETGLWSLNYFSAAGILVLASTLVGSGVAHWSFGRQGGLAGGLSEPRRWRVITVAGSMLAGCGMWYFRAGRSLGDHENYLLMLRNSQWFYMSQPLSTALFAAANGILARVNWPPEAAIALVNCLAGVVWVFCLLTWAGETPDWKGKLLLVCVLPAGGAAIFFGYIEATALPLAAALIYLYFAHRVLRGESLLPAACACGIALALHGLMLMLLPSFAVLSWVAWRMGKRRELMAAWLLVFLPGLLTVGYAVTHPELILGKVYGDALGGGDDRMFVPLTGSGEDQAPYALFSLGHMLEVLNLFLMAAPFAGLMVIRAIQTIRHRWMEPFVWFLASVAVAGGLFVFLWNPDLGMVRDWDLFTPPAMLVLLTGALLWPEEAQLRPAPVWLGAASGFGLATLALTVARFSPVAAWNPWDTDWIKIQYPLEAGFVGGAELLGFDLPEASLRPGQTLKVFLYWRTRRPLPVDYTAFVQLVRFEGGVADLVAQDDHRPLTVNRFSSNWIVGEVVKDEHQIAIPGTLPPGTYRLWTGLYDLNTLERLPLAEDEGETIFQLTAWEISKGD